MVDRPTAGRLWRAMATAVRPYRWPAVFLVLGIAAGVLGTVSFYTLHRTVVSQSPAVAGPITPAIPRPPERASAGTHIQPTTLDIPQIGLSTELVDLGLNENGALEAPADFDVAGWFAAGPAPGDGSGPPAVIAGHVDSSSGPAIFYRLRELKAGSVITVGGIDNVARRFVVYRTAQYAKTAFPAAEVYARAERSELRLITCSGDFDSDASSYLSNLVVYAAQADGG